VAVWQYCDESAVHIFGQAEADPTANRIVEALHAAGGELTQTEVSKLFQRNLSAKTLAAVLQGLSDAGKVVQHKPEVVGIGRPSVVWRLVGNEKNEFNEKTTDLVRLIRLIRSKETPTDRLATGRRIVL
jgi:predicted ArsR family transcriptional regulator